MQVLGSLWPEVRPEQLKFGTSPKLFCLLSPIFFVDCGAPLMMIGSAKAVGIHRGRDQGEDAHS